MHCNSNSFSELFPGLGGIASVKCNANGNKVSILVSKVRQSSSLTAPDLTISLKAGAVQQDY